MLFQIDTGYACAGIETNKQGIVCNAAPIFAWMVGKSFSEIKKWGHIKRIREC